MKTKNVKVRMGDIRQGRVAYVAHPVYGIEKVTFLGRPYINKTVGSPWVDTLTHYGRTSSYERDRSLCDMGVTGLYNGRRTFWKLKHAVAWVKKWSTDLGFKEQHAEHERFCAMMDDLEHLYPEYEEPGAIYDEDDEDIAESEVFN